MSNKFYDGFWISKESPRTIYGSCPKGIEAFRVVNYEDFEILKKALAEISKSIVRPVSMTDACAMLAAIEKRCDEAIDPSKIANKGEV